MSVNTGYGLPTLPVAAKEVWAALVPATGTGQTIPFLIHPTSVQSTNSARFSEVQLFKGASFPTWVGNSAEQLQVEALVYQRARSDIRPLLNLLKGSVGQDKLWLYSHGDRVVGPVAVTGVTVRETQWYAGVPIRADVSVTMVRVGVLPTISSTASNKLTAAEKAAGVKAAAKALGVAASMLSITDTGTVTKQGKTVGTYKSGRFTKST